MASRSALERLRERKARHRLRSRAYRVSFAVAGFLLVALGLILVPLPGPGWLVVALGLGMLALEFDRAERWLERLLVRLERVSERTARAGRLQRALGVVLVVAATAAWIGAIALWDVPLLPG